MKRKKIYKLILNEKNSVFTFPCHNLRGNHNNHGVMGLEFFGLQVDHGTQRDPAMLSVLPWDAQKV